MFISYDAPQAIAVKARYVLQHRLGGMMFWELSEDYNDELLDVIDATLREPPELSSPEGGRGRCE